MSEFNIAKQLRQSASRYDPADPLIQQVHAVADAIDAAIQGDPAPLETWQQKWPEERSKLKAKDF